jgi:hypothetical protein
MLALAVAVAGALSGCSYSTMDACLEHHNSCHETLDGNFFPGHGIDINSPAGQAMLNGFMQHQMPFYQQPQTLWVRQCTIYNQIAGQC